jgi:rhodanese-related sulfurtransferase
MKNLFLSILIFISLFAGCKRAEAQQAVYKKISAVEAHKMMSELQDYTLLDVRTDAEYKEQRITGAKLIPDYEILDRAEKELSDKTKVILIYCRSGRRSENAARTLVRLGYINVYDFGGIIQWSYETESD